MLHPWMDTPDTFCWRRFNLKHNVKSHMHVRANSISEFSVLEGLNASSME